MLKKKLKDLKKVDKAINYNRLSIVDKNNKQVFGFTKYMDLDLIAKKGRKNAR